MAFEPPCCPHPQPGQSDKSPTLGECYQEDRVPLPPAPTQGLQSLFWVGQTTNISYPLSNSVLQSWLRRPESTFLVHSAAYKTGWCGPLSKTCCQLHKSGSDISPRERGRPQKERAPRLHLTFEREWGRLSLRIFLKTVEPLVITRRQVTPWEQECNHRPAGFSGRLKERKS